MTSIEDIQIGDKVRVTWTGEAIAFDAYGVILDNDVRLDRRAKFGRNRQIEILEKRRTEVGDMLDSPAAYEKAPEGTVVEGTYDTGMKTIAGWIFSDQPKRILLSDLLRTPRKVVYVPASDF